MKKIDGASQMQVGELRAFSVDGISVGVYKHSDHGFYTFEDACTHDGAEICNGHVEGTEVICPRHGARFDMRDGSVRRMPATSPLEVFANEIKDGELYVEIDNF